VDTPKCLGSIIRAKKVHISTTRRKFERDFKNELPRSKLRGIPRNSVCDEKPRFLMLFLAVTPEQAPRNLTH
jgi:hypothetical protein